MKLDGTCLCGNVIVTLARQPALVNMCHCSSCQRRSGSPFGMAVWLAQADVEISGETRQFDHVSDKDRTITNRFCPTCGTTVAFAVVLNPGLIAIPAGIFADPTCPPPLRSVFEESRHPWVAVPEGAMRLERGRDG
ncbi:MAG: GFA family protein [Sandarakinorhabdus sp.]|nr:GFA family protein [Sandarakinorhabdus sp.]